MADPVYIPLPEAGWPLIELGFGLVEVAEGRQPVERVDGTKDERPALIFGRNGSGKVGDPLTPDRQMLPGEPLAVVTFANVESLDVVMDKLRIIRERMAADGVDVPPATPCIWPKCQCTGQGCEKTTPRNAGVTAAPAPVGKWCTCRDGYGHPPCPVHSPGVTAAPAPLADDHRKVLTDLLSCCLAWEPQVCVMGNVRAGDAAEALAEVLGIGTDGVTACDGDKTK